MNDIRKHFPIYTHQPDLVYLDSAATTLKPEVVIEAELGYYREYSANVERGLYPLSEKATNEYEHAREKVAHFIGADTDEVVFTRGTTESLNLLASSLEQLLWPVPARSNLTPTLSSTEARERYECDEILVSGSEHHSNFLPWQVLATRRGLTLTILPFDSEGRLRVEDLEHYITPQTKIFSFVAVSNVFGVINPVQALIAEAKRLNPDIITIVDAAQSIAHLPTDVRVLDCDFLAASGHKMFGPTGIGFLYGKQSRLAALPPYHYGGEMVAHASVEGSIWKEAPHKFEAGTPAIAQAIGLGAAVDFIQSVGWEAMRVHEIHLLTYAFEQLTTHFGDTIQIVGSCTAHEKSGVIAFTLKGIHPHDIAQILGDEGICIRAGRHCAEPLHDILSLPATARLAISVYTTEDDIQRLVHGLEKARSLFMR